MYFSAYSETFGLYSQVTLGEKRGETIHEMTEKEIKRCDTLSRPALAIALLGL